MKHKLAFLIIGIAILIAVTANIVLFTIVPETIIAHPAFWVTWVFTFPVNLVLLIIATLYVTGKKKNAVVRIPPVLYVVYTFTGLYFSIGFKLIRLPFETPKLPFLIETVITVLYLSALAFMVVITQRIEKQEGTVKKKIAYLGILRADLEGALPYVSDKTLRKAVEKLVEAIRYSDPMSHESLQSTEKELSKTVKHIVTALKKEENPDVYAEITKAEALLAARNERCKLLK